MNFKTLKWAWQAHFFNHTPVIFENCIFFMVVEMILLTFFDTPNQKSLTWRFQFAIPEHSPHPVTWRNIIKLNLTILSKLYLEFKHVSPGKWSSQMYVLCVMWSIVKPGLQINSTHLVARSRNVIGFGKGKNLILGFFLESDLQVPWTQ